MIAYIGGTLGVLIGADLLRLDAVRKLGGAGTFDGIFLSGLVAALLAKGTSDLSHPRESGDDKTYT